MNRDDSRGPGLAVSEGGRGEPVVLVHGSASDGRTWDPQREAFSREFRTIVYSRRYHWPNEPIPDGVPYAMDVHVDDLERLVQARSAAPVHLVGHSYGGFLCLLLALRAPALVRSMVLTEPPVVSLFVSNPPTLAEVLRLAAARPRMAFEIVRFGVAGVARAERAFRRGDLQTGARVFGDAVFGAGALGRLPLSQREQVQANLANIKAEILGPGFVPLDPAAVRKVAVPTLLVTGARSVALFRQLTNALQELLPHVERVEVPGATHLVHADNSTAFNGAALAYLLRHRGSGASHG